MFGKARAPASSKQIGDLAEARALSHLQDHGLVLVERNYRVARGPSARGGEIDLVMRARDGTLVFVEVRSRSDARFGGAAATVGVAKQRRIVFAAQSYLMRMATPPPCRFDLVTVEGSQVRWLPAAFDL